MVSFTEESDETYLEKQPIAVRVVAGLGDQPDELWASLPSYSQPDPQRDSQRHATPTRNHHPASSRLCNSFIQQVNRHQHDGSERYRHHDP